MEDETIEVNKEKLRKIQSHADYAYGKFSKDHSFPDPTQRTKHIADQLNALIEGRDEDLEEYEFDRPF